jgi:hypothetical protein
VPDQSVIATDFDVGAAWRGGYFSLYRFPASRMLTPNQ